MRTAIKWGVFLGVAVCVWTLIIHMPGFRGARIGTAISSLLIGVVGGAIVRTSTPKAAA